MTNNQEIAEINRQIDELIAKLKTVSAEKYEEQPILQQITKLQERILLKQNNNVMFEPDSEMISNRKYIAYAQSHINDEERMRGLLQFSTRLLAAHLWNITHHYEEYVPLNLRPPSSNNPAIPRI